jgi:hypothetical protein
LKKIAGEKELSDKKAPYSKRTFCKEVNAIAHKASKNSNIKLVKKAISSASRASIKKTRKIQMSPMLKKLSLQQLRLL